MKSPLHHLKHPELLFDHFHKKIHHAFVIFGLAIMGMLWWASHILTPTSASWQRWGFLTSEFWQQNPSNANIMYAVFGDSTPWSTAYTRLWTTSCIPTTIQVLPANFTGLVWLPNTIYILNPGTYTLTSPIVMNDCSALIGTGDVVVKASSTATYIDVSNRNNTILDNISFDGNGAFIENIKIQNSQNISVNNIKSYNSSNYGFNATYTTGMMINNSYFLKNNYGLAINSWCINTSINNVLSLNNTQYGIRAYNADYTTINNTQTFNNMYGISMEDTVSTPWRITIANSLVYNNDYGISSAWVSWYLYNVDIYNTTTWVYISSTSGWVEYYWTLHAFNTSFLTWGVKNISSGSSSPLDRWIWYLDISTPSLTYDRMTNVQNGSWQQLLSWTNRTWMKSPQFFDLSKKPIRYIFWWNILKQTIPVRYNNGILEKYGTDWADYTTTQYIAEPWTSLLTNQQLLVNQYFWSWSTFTQNWQTNWCSLSSFQVKTLDPATFTSTYSFEDHTIYLLTGGEYISSVAGINNGFVFNGNCIALIWRATTRFTKSGWGGLNSIFYANNKRNIIIDNIKVDGLYYNNTTQTSIAAQSAIKFDGASNNSTLNQVQLYNASSYGIYFGLGSHHNTLINSQIFNNLVAGIYFYYSSNYNVVTNVQSFNNALYGIWLANWSNRNTMNNIQVYNNVVGIFWDLTTQENVVNRAAVYNNSDAGISLKNSSGNILNDVRVYNNIVGIRALYNSVGNKYYGEMNVSNNRSGNFDGTTGNDSSLSPGSAWFFAYGWVMTTWVALSWCLYTNNPKLSGSTILSLFANTLCNNTGYISSFVSPNDTAINYTFGSNMYKQTIPVRYITGNTLAQTPTQYDSTKYITETFPLQTMLLFWPDDIAPTTPSLLYLLSGEKVFFVTFEWTASTDIGSWLAGYVYEIAIDSGFVHITNTGFITTTTGTLWSPTNNDFDTGNGKYYWRMKAKDKNGNYSPRSNIGYFTLVRTSNRDFNNKSSANLKTYYDSNTITIDALRTGLSVWATVDTGVIYKNGIAEGTGTFVQNGDKIYITIKSRDEYDATVASLLTIANRTLEFIVTTKQEWDTSCTLADTDKTTIQSIFDSLVQNYSGDANKFDEFLYTMQSMLTDEIDFTNDCNLQYLKDLISGTINGTMSWGINTGTYMAPNCKEYAVNFDSTKIAYTSPSFKILTFFANRDALGRYIDAQNPGDCHINTYSAASWIFTNTDPSRHIASNGKIYTILSDSQWYTTNEFTIKKYFGTISELRNYIDSKNPPQQVRSHQVDTSFTPQVYTAPNTKAYTIYKTDRWYMSYKLLKIRYFTSLGEIQYFINKNNPK